MRLAVPVGPVHCVHYLTTWTIAHFGLLWLASCCLVTSATLSRNTKVCRTKLLHPAAEYMALPASQYSVLDAQRIERLDESTFRCYVGGLRLFSLVVEPVLTVSVVVGERGPTVKLLQTEVRSPGAQQKSISRRTSAAKWLKCGAGYQVVTMQARTTNHVHQAGLLPVVAVRQCSISICY